MGSIYSKPLIVILNLITIQLLTSCSTVPKSDFQNYYYSPDYEDKSFENVHMDICIPKNKYEYNAGLDSNTISFQINFDTTFRKFFPEGIKLFSSVNETGWIYYENNFDSEPIFYEKQSNDGNYLYSVDMPDSLSFFQKKSNSDFLFVIHYIMFAGNPPEMDYNKSNRREEFESIITLRYSLWNTLNLELVATDEVTTRMVFNNLADKWPLRGVTLKSAYEIFERLPMFSK